MCVSHNEPLHLGINNYRKVKDCCGKDEKLDSVILGIHEREICESEDKNQIEKQTNK